MGAGTATGPGVTALAATPGYGGGYAPGQTGVQPIHQGYPAPAVPAGYGPEPTELFTATPTEFDGLFRSEDGSPGAYGQTQLLPPVVEADYRMPPPGASPPPGRPGREDPDGNGPRSNRPVVLATVGAVVVAAGVILGLLYLGNQSTSSGTTASAGTSTGPVSSASVSQNGGQISVPTDGATLGPTATTPSTAATTPSSPASTAAGDFHGDSLPLGPGSSGDWVKWVQQRLKQLGYYHGSDSGSFDQATALAVQQFQADAGVTGDAASTVGLHTIVALEAAGDTPNLRMGDRSPDVARLNAALTYATGTRVSGSRYSTATEADVFGYQQAVGLNPTGQVDAATWAKLQDGTLASG
ncbi:MAG TPA: peptidoglycan-binding domain-containing protein [Actinospica sp.]|nr:peptidoglycan-binding domain-containing protein [Actinospica sp.]